MNGFQRKDNKPAEKAQVIPARKLSKEEILTIQKQGERYVLSGSLLAGHRDSGIYSVGQYAFSVLGLGYNKVDERISFVLEWLFSVRTFSSDRQRKQAIADVHRACRWTPKRDHYQYSESRLVELHLTPDQARYANLKRSNTARAKIQAAVREMVSTGEVIGLNSLMRATGCHWKTVKKHQDIWGEYALGHRTPITAAGGLGDKKKEMAAAGFKDTTKRATAIDLVTTTVVRPAATDDTSTVVRPLAFRKDIEIASSLFSGPGARLFRDSQEVRLEQRESGSANKYVKRKEGLGSWSLGSGSGCDVGEVRSGTSPELLRPGSNSLTPVPPDLLPRKRTQSEWRDYNREQKSRAPWVQPPPEVKEIVARLKKRYNGL